jgi:hypothetical protein
MPAMGGCSSCSIGTWTNPGGNYVGVRLADAEDGKTTLVFTGEVQVKAGERILVETDGGPEFAEVTTTSPGLPKACSARKARRFLRLASDSEYADYSERLDLQREAKAFADSVVEERRLDLNVVKAQVGFDRRKIVLLFTADKKVETRDLARAIAEKFEMRVDVRMMGVRDETKLLGGIGSCGLTLHLAPGLSSGRHQDGEDAGDHAESGEADRPLWPAQVLRSLRAGWRDRGSPSPRARRREACASGPPRPPVRSAASRAARSLTGSRLFRESGLHSSP